jgi:hypothetical protein
MQATHSNSKSASLASLLSRLTGIGPRNTTQPLPEEAQDYYYAGKDPVDCGGYNEAFVMQYWTGYNPRH